MIISHPFFYIYLLEHLLPTVTDIPSRSNHFSIQVQMRFYYSATVSLQYIR